MRKFLILLQKEVRELINARTVLPLILVMAVFYFFGGYINKQTNVKKGPEPIAIIDQDNSPLSKSLISSLEQVNFSPKIFLTSDDLSTQMRQENISFGLLIPANFSNSVQNLTPKKIETYTSLKSFSVMNIGKYAGINTAIAQINNQVSNLYLSEKVPNISPVLLKNPISTTSYTIIKSNISQTDSTAVLSYLGTQTYLIPIILFLVIVFATQMIATSVASEKENKTLETLLTAPINRKVLVTAKMVASGIVGLLLASVYLIGFRSYINGVSSLSTTTQGVSSDVLHSLGLQLSVQSYLLLGLVLFLGILVALAMAMILGAFAEDVKSVQTVITPLMVLMLIPYFVTLFLDINTLPNIARYIVYAIPFTHVFMAMGNLYLHNTLAVIYGSIYELIVFIIFVWLAAWIFSSDKIMTMRLNFSKKKK